MSVYGLNPKQIKYLIVKPVLTAIGLGGVSAINLITGTALAESKLAAIRQITSTSVLTGTARGLWQIEPITAKDMMDRILPRNKNRKHIVETYMSQQPLNDQLVSNLALGAIICRLKYLSSPKPMVKNDAALMSEYHKFIYNTSIGKADSDVNVVHFQTAIDL